MLSFNPKNPPPLKKKKKSICFLTCQGLYNDFSISAANLVIRQY